MIASAPPSANRAKVFPSAKANRATVWPEAKVAAQTAARGTPPIVVVIQGQRHAGANRI